MTTHKHRKGTTVKPTGHTANTASTPKTGLFAPLRGLLHVRGSGLSKISYSQAGPDSLTADGPSKSGRPEENSGSCAGAPKSAIAARRYLLTTLVTLCAAAGVLLCSSVQALAAVEAPGWEVSGYTGPTVLAPGSTGNVWFFVDNTGAAENTGGTLTDTLPAGLKATGGENCTGETVVVCSIPPLYPGDGEPYNLSIPVRVVATQPGEETNRVTVGGGGAANIASASFPVKYGTTPAAPGFSSFDAWFSNTNGSVDTQAGSHPYQFTLNFSTNSVVDSSGYEVPVGEPRNLDFKFPPGIVGNPNVVPQCPRADFDEGEEGESVGKGCPASTRIGFDVADLGNGFGAAVLPVFNLVPPAGVAAEFAFDVRGIVTFLDAKVRSGGDYGITEHVFDVPKRYILFNSITIWGNPSEVRFNIFRRGPGCEEAAGGGCAYTGTQAPFLTMPTSCGKPQPIFAEMIGTWQDEDARARAEVEPHNSEGAAVGIAGCERLVHFEPTAAIAPDTTSADTPAGLTAEVKVPQNVNPETLSTSGLKDTTVTLPEGIAINPGQATGLVACQRSQENIEPGTEAGESEAMDGPPRVPRRRKSGRMKSTLPYWPIRLWGTCTSSRPIRRTCSCWWRPPVMV
jgi:hypothetical protein